jgi:exodeoxyribonuclease-3
MRIVSWNIRHGGGTRIDAILRCVAKHRPDVLVLVEFRQGLCGDKLRAGLSAQGLGEQALASAGPKQNSVLLASRKPFDLFPLPGIGAGDAHRVVGASFGDLDVHGFYFSQGEQKIPLWRSLVAAVPTMLSRPTLLVGDFNTGRHRVDEKGATFHCADYFEALLAAGMIDGWRHFHGDTTAWTWLSNHGNGFRLDHAFVSPLLLPRLKAADYSHVERESKVSDHSLLIVDLA